MKVKIFGAGSIGNHLAQACRRLGYDVVVVDRDGQALQRMKQEIYPSRYGAWDESIQLFPSGEEPKGGFDIIMVGTPPDTHMALAQAALLEKPKLIHIEKPLCTPDFAGVKEFKDKLRAIPDVMVTVGYDYALNHGVRAISDMIRQQALGRILTIDVEVREHWSGIFSAHPWLSGPEDAYLGYWRRGGGAGGEHSHALHLWQYFAYEAEWGGVREVKAMFDFKKVGKAEYDSVAAFLLRTEQGGIGRVVQDVITLPVKCWARIQGSKGFAEWHLKGSPEGDLVRYQIEGEELKEEVFPKKRPEDFYRELLHYDELLAGKIRIEDSPISFERGLEAMEILNKSYPL